jgi:FG-GAP repeat protein
MKPGLRLRTALAAFSLSVVSVGGVAGVGGLPWRHTLLKAGDGTDHDDFGWELAIDGTTALVGAVRRTESGKDSGAVYVFERIDGTWREAGKLTARGVGAGA